MKSCAEFIKKSKMICLVTHTDSDGICSGVLMHRVLESFGKKAEIVFSSTNLLQKESFYRRIPEADLYIFTDLAVDQAWDTASCHFQDKRIIIIDHHLPKKNLSSKDIIHINPMFASDKYTPASKIVFDEFSEKLKGSKWVALVGVWGDMGYSEWKDFFRDQDLKEIKEMDKSVGSAMMYIGERGAEYVYNLMKDSSKEDFLKEKRLKAWSKRIDEYLMELSADFERNAEKFNDSYFFEYSPKHNVGSALSTILSLKNANKTIILLNLSGDMIRLNFRRQDGKRDMNELARLSTQDIGSGGGHAKAAGGVIEAEMKELFKQRAKQWLKEKLNE